MINSRVSWVVIFSLIIFILLAVKLFDIQILKNEEKYFFAKQQQSRTEIVKAERGLIFDRNNIQLAQNRNDISFFLDRYLLKNSDKLKAAKKLSKIFNNKSSYYLKLIREDTTTVCIEKKAPNEKKSLLKDLDLRALYYRNDPTRIYNYNNLASHILGYVDKNMNGVDGIEDYFNNFLRGEDGVRIVEKSHGGKMITVREEDTKPSIPGLNVQLTIDKKFQVILEEEIKKGVLNYKGSSGVGIIMNPNNGEILALASIGDFDPNNYSEYDDSQRRNRCISDTYEPGSTFKGIALAALFDKYLCNENEVVDVENGVYQFKGRKIFDTHKFKYLTVKGVFEQSSNIGMSKLVQRINGEEFYKYLRGFGFGTTTSIELPGEVSGVLVKPTSINALTKSSISRGYTISVTPLQLVTAYSAVINGGTLYKPQIVKRILSSEGEVKHEFHPREVRRVISPETSERMKALLESAVKNGTGKNAMLDMVSVGGKTGTAKILKDGKYQDNEYNSSFIGFFPVDEPQVICLIVLHSPKVGGYGGLVAAPIFKEVSTRILTSLPESYQRESEESEKENKVQFIKAKNVDLDLSLENSFPKPKNSSEHLNIANDIMPDLKNYSLREAILVLSRLGVKYTVIGSGKIIAQSIPAGTKLRRDLTCKINCSEIKNNTTLN